MHEGDGAVAQHGLRIVDLCSSTFLDEAGRRPDVAAGLREAGEDRMAAGHGQGRSLLPHAIAGKREFGEQQHLSANGARCGDHRKVLRQVGTKSNRTSVREGKMGYVRVVLGGSLIMKNKK